MTVASFATSSNPQLTIKCHNDLSITGTAEPSISITIDDDSPANRIDRTAETIVVTAMDSCAIVCPLDTTLTLELVSGDLRVNQIKGTLVANAINGDAALRDVGPVDIRLVQGDLAIRDAAGNVHVDVVRGDVKLKRIAGSASIDRVSGDLGVYDVGASAAFGDIGGDASLEISLQPDQVYAAHAGGDLELRVNGGGAVFALACGGDLRTRLPLNNWAGTDHAGTGTYGDGSAKVSLNAGGDLLVLPGKGASGGFDPDVFSDQVESMIESAMSQFESQMSRVQRDLEQRWGNDAAVERAAQRAQRSAERAKRRAERTTATLGMVFGPPRPPAPPAPPSEPVTDQERMAILKMVEDGKITADQAAALLSALES